MIKGVAIIERVGMVNPVMGGAREKGGQVGKMAHDQ